MARYKVTFKKSVTKDFRSIPNIDVKRILKRIELLAINPREIGCIKLSGGERYRVRLGVYRIIYEIRDEVLLINIVKIAHRSKVYQ